MRSTPCLGYKEEIGYKFTTVDVTLLVSGYADDIGIFTEWNHENQFILDKVDEWLKWTGVWRQTQGNAARQPCVMDVHLILGSQSQGR